VTGLLVECVMDGNWDWEAREQKLWFRPRRRKEEISCNRAVALIYIYIYRPLPQQLYYPLSPRGYHHGWPVQYK
jgi:hypothetical protein